MALQVILLFSCLVASLVCTNSVPLAPLVQPPGSPIQARRGDGSVLKQYIVALAPTKVAGLPDWPLTGALNGANIWDAISSVLPGSAQAQSGSRGLKIFGAEGPTPSFAGFSGFLDDSELPQLLAHPGVRYVEEDRPLFLNGTAALYQDLAPVIGDLLMQTDADADAGAGAGAVAAQDSSLPWGLDRCDQRNLPLDGAAYVSQGSKGDGIHVYVVDTGVRETHEQFEGRATDGKATDCHGHGTHVAGVIIGKTTGIAPSARVRAVRALNCEGSGATSTVIQAVNWIASDLRSSSSGSQRVLVSMSIGGSYSKALNEAVEDLVGLGATVLAAAGNFGRDACGGPSQTSPASAAGVIAVGASGADDTMGSFSSYGSCVTIFAPGVDIMSAWAESDTAYKSLSGTSMATPHVTGALAAYASASPASSATPASLAALLKCAATSGKVSSLPSGTANRLLFTPLACAGSGTGSGSGSGSESSSGSGPRGDSSTGSAASSSSSSSSGSQPGFSFPVPSFDLPDFPSFNPPSLTGFAGGLGGLSGIKPPTLGSAMTSPFEFP